MQLNLSLAKWLFSLTFGTNFYKGRIFTFILLFFGFSLSAQTGSDSTVSFRVYGACSQCEDRILEAAKGKGVKQMRWNIDSRMFTVTFDPSKTGSVKIKKRIVAVGHDTDDFKARESVYKNLPECCRYRELQAQLLEDQRTQELMKALDSLKIGAQELTGKETDSIQNEKIIKGVVMEVNKKGAFLPLSGASVIWMGTQTGTTTNESGVFSIQRIAEVNRLMISYAGYASDTVEIGNVSDLKVIIGSNNKLAEVRIASRRKSTSISLSDPFRMQVMTEKELFKAACCNLSESFETNPAVDVSFSDAVTGSKQIQLLGLSGIYTQLTLENQPGPRGIATTFGLNAVPGTWVESIQLTKGIGSVVNGYESIAGQINIELKKPDADERLYANAYVNDFGKVDLNLNLSSAINDKWSVALLMHDAFFNNPEVDFNKDGFRDLPTGNQLSLFNRWKYDDGKGFVSQFGLRYYNGDKTGGQVDYRQDEDKFTTHHYGLEINTERYEAFSKIGYIFPEKKYKSIGMQLSYIDHRQNSYYGFTVYDARQKNIYANLIYQSIINNTAHKFRTGLSFLNDAYDEDFGRYSSAGAAVDNYRRAETVPGAFFEYTWMPSDKFSMVAGLRGDYNSLFGYFTTPRLHLKYQPFKNTSIRASAGRGQRTANIFAENNSSFVSSRDINIIRSVNEGAYGLNAEVAWNKGISIDQKMRLFSREAMLSLDYFRNDFKNQVVVDLEQAREIRYYDLVGKSYSNSFQAELNFLPVKNLEVRMAWRYFDVRSTYSGKLLQAPMVARDRAFLNLAYSLSGWSFDYTLNYVGKKRIPNTLANPEAYRFDAYSPDYFVMNAQITKRIGRKRPMDFYLGAENISNFFQQRAIISPEDPFSPYFDASLVWGPVSGRMFYLGWRYKIK